MATFVDVGLLEKFSTLFVFVLVLLLVYAFLQKSAIFGEGKAGLNALIAFLIAILIALSTTVVAIFRSFIPAIFVISMVVFAIIIGFQSFGVKEEEISSAFKSRRDLQWMIALAVIIIFVAIIFNVYNKSNELTEEGKVIQKNYSDSQDLYNQTELDVNYDSGVFNPKIIGLLLILLIGAFAVRLLSANNMGKQE